MLQILRKVHTEDECVNGVATFYVEPPDGWTVEWTITSPTPGAPIPVFSFSEQGDTTSIDVAVGLVGGEFPYGLTAKVCSPED